MRFTTHTLRLILVALLTACVFASNAAADGKRIALGDALRVGPGASTKPCSKRTARAARLLSTRGRTATTRRARRAATKQRRRCLNRLRRAAKRKRAPATISLTTQVSGNLVVGIDGGWSGWSDSEIVQRRELGAAVTRHEWDPLLPVDEQDEEVQIAATEIHTRIHALLGANDLGDPGHYRDWVVAFVRRYGLGGSFWAEHPELDEAAYAIRTVELGNEPYFGTMTAEEYADTVRPTLERIKELDLPVGVLLPVYLHGEDLTWLETLYERIPNLNFHYSALAFHPYWYGRHPATSGDSGPLERIVALRKRMDELGAAAKPIHLTEYGESTAACGSECVSEDEQATHLSAMIEAIVSHPAWKVEMLSVFQLLDRGTADPDRELQFGLLREDGTPKPAYPIVRAAIQLYR